jgi:hypothetical protein
MTMLALSRFAFRPARRSAFRAMFGAVVVGFALAVGCGGAGQSDLLSGGDSGATQDGASRDSARDSATNDVGVKDAAMETAPPPDQGVNCPGQGFCMVPGQVCCLDTSTGNSTFSCTSSDGDASNPCMALSIPCDDAADCAAAGSPGDVCCVTASGNDTAGDVSCRSPADCSTQGHARVCNPSGPADQCPMGKTCKPSTKTLPGFYLCL